MSAFLFGHQSIFVDPYICPRYSASGQKPCNCVPPALIEVSSADSYMEQTVKAAAWASLSLQQKNQGLKSSQDALRTLRWCTDEPDCCGRNLEESYQAAASELALVLIENSASILGASSQLPAPVLKRELRSFRPLGETEQEFFAPSLVAQIVPRDGRVGSHSPTVLRLYPWLLDLVKCWIDSDQNSSSISIVRG